MKILIKVTKDVLNRSQFCQVTEGNDARKSCAIALAVREIFPNAEVYGFGIVINPIGDLSIQNSISGKGYDIFWGDKAPQALWIGIFDNLSPWERLAIPEFSFEIEVPNEIIEKIGIGEVYRILSESKTLEHVPV